MAAQIVEATENLSELIAAQPKMLVEFYSSTCGPCKMLSFILKDVAKGLPDDFIIAQVNFDKFPELVKHYEVQGYPTMILFKEGKEAERMQGLKQKPAIVAMLES